MALAVVDVEDEEDIEEGWGGDGEDDYFSPSLGYDVCTCTYTSVHSGVWLRVSPNRHVQVPHLASLVSNSFITLTPSHKSSLCLMAGMAAKDCKYERIDSVRVCRTRGQKNDILIGR